MGQILNTDRTRCALCSFVAPCCAAVLPANPSIAHELFNTFMTQWSTSSSADQIDDSSPWTAMAPAMRASASYLLEMDHQRKLKAGLNVPQVSLEEAKSKAGANPWFGFIPTLEAKVSYLASSSDGQWTGRCFKDTSVHHSGADEKGLDLTFSLKNKTDDDCSEVYLLATMTDFQLALFDTAGTEQIRWDKADGLSAAQLFDLETSGIRVFRLPGDLAEAA